MAKYLLALLLLLAPQAAHADELLDWISALTGYPIPATPPTIEYISGEALSELAGDRMILGAYLFGENTVYLHEDLDIEGNVCARSVLAHEYTHYVQARVMKSFPEREREALLVTAVYLQTWRLPPWQAHFDNDVCEAYLRSRLSGAMAWIAPRP